MHLKTVNAIGLSLVLTSGVVANDGRTVQAESKKMGNCARPCFSRSGGVRIGAGRREVIEALINSRQAKVDDYLILSDIYRQEGNYGLAQERLSQGLELSKQNGDTEGQAMAHTRLGEIFSTTGNLDAASSNLRAARNLYVNLKNNQQINSVDQQLGTLQRQIAPSRLQINPRTRIQHQ